MANAAKIQADESRATGTGSASTPAVHTYTAHTHTSHVDTFARDRLPPPELQPEFVFARPELQYPERLNCVSHFLDRWVEEGHGEDPCLFGAEISFTYRQFQYLVNRIANVLVGTFGLVTGGRVLLRSANNPMMVATYLAVLKAGGIVVATMPLLRAKELAYPIQKAEIALALCDGKLADEMEKAKAIAPKLQRIVYWGTGDPGSLEQLVSEASPEFAAVDTASDDICLIAFTSGTTGEPKGTMHFHRDMLAVCDGYARNVLRANRTDRFIGSAPLAFTFGFGGVLFPMHIGASFVVLEKAGPDDLPVAIERYKATVCFTAPTSYRAMLGKIADHDLSSLRKCVSAGETLPKATFDAWLKATGIKLMDGIGSTEMLHIFVSATEDQIRPGATGKPVPGYEAKIVDDEGKDLPAGSMGRLAVRGPTGCRYLADERQRKYVQNGWNITGDTYVMDEDGYFWYQSRSDDMIVSAGYNIAGPDVEAALLTHPAVAECGVVGAPDEARGMVVKAYVVLAPGAIGDAMLATELQDHVKREIAPYKYPRAIEFVAQLPKTETGKLKRFALRQIAQASAASASAGIAAE
ncbi:benzoate-CoA ligase family protein [Bradyrhizobium sp. dw_78]|uniref:benzoate-CoA ligase family protein n=1 Tax=Bradyrhizobium sp. dw_78 TaxID=2719793 RepID=UPI001BD37B80|nr:benzoate-CoA ligase family protein [Bradyrhizobium sp. dw_78]